MNESKRIEYFYQNAICKIVCENYFSRGGCLSLKGTGWPFPCPTQAVQDSIHFSRYGSFLIASADFMVEITDIISISLANDNVIIRLGCDREIELFVISPMSSACYFWAACAASLIRNCITNDSVKDYQSLKIMANFNSIAKNRIPDGISDWFCQLNLPQRVLIAEGSFPKINLVGVTDVSASHLLPKSDVASTNINIIKFQSASLKGTADSLKQGSISATAGTVPKFIPSLGIKPESFDSTGTLEGDFKYALSTAHVHFQSFFNDHHVVTVNGISDDIISFPCFDEGLYCSLVKEMHRYSLVEISNNHAELAKNNAGLGAIVGSFIGIISGNIFAPFLGHSYGKNLTDRGKPIEEFLPDPNLLFYQDDNSYLSWSRAQVNSPRLRRIIFNRQLSEDGKVYFRLIPAIVTADSVLPVQLFKVNDSTYFYRPLAAGIDRNQPNYDTIRIQKKYFHLRGEGTIEKMDFEIDVYGNDVEPNEKIRLHRFSGQSLDYFYADFKILPGSIF